MQESIDHPIITFGKWYEEMLKVGGIREPSAMVLSTCNTENRPSSRVVLLKKYSDGGFEFFTNFNSRKGREIAANPYVSLVFDWRSIYRQVRVEGMAEFMDDWESDAYHDTRSRESQISVWCSQQSTIIPDREEFFRKFELAKQQFEGKEVPRPKHWGGIRVVPYLIEFWTDGTHRMHERKQYSKGSDGTWSYVYLYP